MSKGLTKYNTISTNALKIWAIVAMVCDHIPYLSAAVQTQYYLYPWFLMHAFGRITAPVFFYLLALGYRRTRDANRYTLRLLAFALISYVPYILYFKCAEPNLIDFYNNSFKLNVIFTMLFGLLLLRTVHEIQNGALKGLLLVLCLIGGYWCDYGLYGIALILICDVARNSRQGTVIGMGAVIMVNVFLRSSNFFPSDIMPIDYLPTLINNTTTMNFTIVLLCQLLPLILIARHRRWVYGIATKAKPGFFAKWGFYIFYPAHITVLLLIRLSLFGA